ncbi:hypothetical protein [Streptomyces sp. NPDC058665]|uniref:hypothetical protein n=1 Tax=Streptomyces sp. NPDC058665 TaxID=3346586 RepID=UPI003665D9D9
MSDTFDLIDALFSWLGLWLAVTLLMGVAMQLIALCALAVGIGRRTAGMVRTARELRRDRLAAEAEASDDGGEWAIVSPPGQ